VSFDHCAGLAQALAATMCRRPCPPVPLSALSRRRGGRKHGRNWLAAAGFALALAPQLAAADYWRYETETGGVAFTDDPKNIPAKYREGAVAVKEESLFDYGRLSVVDPVRPAPTQAGVAKEPAVPVFAWPVAQPEAPPQGSSVSVNVGGMQINVEGDGDEDEPLYVDRGQYQDLDGNYFDHGGIMSPTTIIRRGDKPLAYIDERRGQAGSGGRPAPCGSPGTNAGMETGAFAGATAASKTARSGATSQRRSSSRKRHVCFCRSLRSMSAGGL
jgi:hypothetical protein